MKRAMLLAAAATAALSLASCQKKATAPEAPAAPAAPEAAAPAAATAPEAASAAAPVAAGPIDITSSVTAPNSTEGLIKGVTLTDMYQIQAGKIAEAKGQSPGVKDFGKMMVTDHTGVNKSATDLAAKLKLTPEDNPTAQSLKKGGEDNVANLKTLSGAAFDKAYVDHEVAYHQQVIDAMDKTLIPNAQNAELKALLVKVRPAFVAHLEHAKSLQGTLQKKAGVAHSHTPA